MSHQDEIIMTRDNKSMMTAGYRYFALFCMLYMTIMICNVTLTNRYVSLDPNIYVLGGTLTSPLVFIIGDIVAEIYGYKVAKQMIWAGFACQLFFGIICWLVANAPYPAIFTHYSTYYYIFNEVIYLVMSSFLAFIISGTLNIYIISRWKILLRGKYFWLRSLGSSTISEAIYTCIVIVMMEMGTIPMNHIWKIILVSYLIKVIYSIVFALPGNLLVNYIKAKTKVDVYDDALNFNPFISASEGKI